MGEEDTELLSQQAVADVLVPVEVRAEGCFGVVHMQAAQPVEPDQPVDVLHDAVELGGVGDVVPGDVEVARVEADAEPRVPVEALDEDGELFERASDRAARAGGSAPDRPGRAPGSATRAETGRRAAPRPRRSPPPGRAPS